MLKRCKKLGQWGLRLSLILLSCPLFSLVSQLELKEGSQAQVTIDQNGVIVVTSWQEGELVWDQFCLSQEEEIHFVSLDQSDGQWINRVEGGERSLIGGKIVSDCPFTLINPKGVVIGEEAMVICERGVELRGDKIVQQGVIKARGGKVTLFGEIVELKEKSLIDTSSRAQGGDVVIGKLDGKLTLYVTLFEGARIKANATERGDGGSVKINSKEGTICRGVLSAQGGPDGGAGGTIEVSTRGKHYEMVGSVDVFSPKGEKGEILFDPKFVFIKEGGSDFSTGHTFAFDPTATARILGSALATALETGNVTIQANTDLYCHDSIAPTSGSNSLTFQAGRSIQIGSTDGDVLVIELNGGAFSAIINDEGAIVSDRDSGDPSLTMTSGTQILTNGGAILLENGSFGGDNTGQIKLFGATLNAGGGIIGIEAYGLEEGNAIPASLYLSDTCLETTGDGEIHLNGTSRGIILRESGVLIEGSTLQTVDGDITLLGEGGGKAEGSYQRGIGIAGSYFLVIGSGELTLDGTGGGGQRGNNGIVFGGESIAETGDGAQNWSGTGGAGGELNEGIRVGGSAVINATGSGAISLTGMGGSGSKTHNSGLVISGSSAFIEVQDGPLTLVGVGGTGESRLFGIWIEGNVEIMSQEGAIELTGTGGAGEDFNFGVTLVGDQVFMSFLKDLTITGWGKGEGTSNQGVKIQRSQIVSMGVGESSGLIRITGTGGEGTKKNNGVKVGGSQARITTVDGNLMIDGAVLTSSPKNQGVLIEYPDEVYSTGKGTVIIVSH